MRTYSPPKVKVLKMRGNTDVQSALPLFMSLVNQLIAVTFFVVSKKKLRNIKHFSKHLLFRNNRCIIYLQRNTNADCVLKLISSGSLISVRSRVVLMCDSGFYFLGKVCRRLHKIAKRFLAMESPCQALRGSGAATDLLGKFKQ